MHLDDRHGSARLIRNDRADLHLGADYHKVHLGQSGQSSTRARLLVAGDQWLGVSTGSSGQVAEVVQWPVNDIAVGPALRTGGRAKS
jgi:thiamine monophosphate synthase